jgi:hypothetical protein
LLAKGFSQVRQDETEQAEDDRRRQVLEQAGHLLGPYERLFASLPLADGQDVGIDDRSGPAQRGAEEHVDRRQIASVGLLQELPGDGADVFVGVCSEQIAAQRRQPPDEGVAGTAPVARRESPLGVAA